MNEIGHTLIYLLYVVLNHNILTLKCSVKIKSNLPKIIIIAYSQVSRTACCCGFFRSCAAVGRGCECAYGNTRRRSAPPSTSLLMTMCECSIARRSPRQHAAVVAAETVWQYAAAACVRAA